MSQPTTWTDQHVNTLVTLWEQGVSVKKISKEIGKSNSSIKMYIQRHRNALGLTKREFVRVQKNTSELNDFDRTWAGSVPCGHWMITKPWRLA